MDEIEKFLDQYTHFRTVRLRDDIWRKLMSKATEEYRKEVMSANGGVSAEIIRYKYSWIGKDRFQYMLSTTFYRESK